jgi:hypothetical protein
MLAFGLILYFYRGLVIHRLLVVLGITAATLFIPATSTYHSLASEGAWNAIQSFDWTENIQNFLNSDSILELRNAAVVMIFTEKCGTMILVQGTEQYRLSICPSATGRYRNEAEPDTSDCQR